MDLVHLFFFNDPATTEIYTLSLHDALPISDHLAAPRRQGRGRLRRGLAGERRRRGHHGDASGPEPVLDRKSTRLNSSHSQISYAVFCLKKKNQLKYRLLAASPLPVPSRDYG